MSYSVIAKTNNTYSPELPYLVNTNEVYIPNPQWWDVYNILKNHPDLDVNGGAWKYAYIVLIDDTIPTITFTVNNSNTSDCQKVTTSDGATYTTTSTNNVSIVHTWDDTNAPICIEGGNSYKTRYYIYWSNKTNNDQITLRYSTITTIPRNLIGIVIHSAKFTNAFCNSSSESQNSIIFLRFINGGNVYNISAPPSYMFTYCSRFEYCDELTTSNFTSIAGLSGSTTYKGRNQFIKALSRLTSTNDGVFGPLAIFKSFDSLTFTIGSGSTTFSGLFKGLLYTKIINATIDCSASTSYFQMFQNCTMLHTFPTLVDVNPAPTAPVVGMYQYCRNARYIPNININATSYDATFYECISLLVVPSNYKFDNVTNLSTTFYACISLVTIESPIDFTNIIVSSAVYATFTYCYSLQNILFVPNTLKISLSLSTSSLLTKASVLSILNGLDLVSPATIQTLTLHTTTKALINSDTELSALRDTVVASGKWQIS